WRSSRFPPIGLRALRSYEEGSSDGSSTRQKNRRIRERSRPRKPWPPNNSWTTTKTSWTIAFFMGKPVVASYCTTFLKPEMLHIYRQVRSLQDYDTFVMTKTLQNSELFPFGDI